MDQRTIKPLPALISDSSSLIRSQTTQLLLNLSKGIQ